MQFKAGMGWLKISLLVVASASVVRYIKDNLYSDLPIVVNGFVEPKFQRVKEAFEANFKESWEPEGAAVTVFHNGKKVVDLWGGYADRSAARVWKEDTMTIVFSTTKAVSAACIAILVDRGLLSYDDPIVKFWPGFGKHGKQNITVQMALTHMGGLAYFDAEITEAAASDHNIMRAIIENEKPKWPPGTRTGYHPYTYGWLVDQIIRHVDPKKRGIGQFLKEEVTNPNNIDFHIGLPETEAHRVARITVPSNWQRVSEILHDYKVLAYFSHLLKLWNENSLLHKAVTNPSWLESVSRCTLNNPEYYRLEQAAALGIGNARSLASIFNLVVSDKMLSKKMVHQLQSFHVNETDLLFEDQVAKGHGFLYLPLNRAGVPYLVGHTGHGCQQIIYDVKNNLVISYVSNGLKTGLYKLCRTYFRLQNSVYDVLEQI